MTKPKHEGMNLARLHPDSGNPAEVVFARNWQEQNDRSYTLEYLLSTTPNKREYVSDRDRAVAATIVQWLGSPVGMSFMVESLKECPSWADYLKRSL